MLSDLLCALGNVLLFFALQFPQESRARGPRPGELQPPDRAPRMRLFCASVYSLSSTVISLLSLCRASFGKPFPGLAGNKGVGFSLHMEAQSVGRADFSPTLQIRKLRPMEAACPGEHVTFLLVFPPQIVVKYTSHQIDHF